MHTFGNFKVRFRYVEPDGCVTIVEVYNLNGDELCKAASICSPSDQFCRKIGRIRALQRAFKQSNLTKTDRTVIWNGLMSIGALKRTKR